ncbi:MAG: hypothetical protein KGV44_04715 [Flavobacteriaceae bacterium]|nr:hypothetical protein [Flavobacteriaceae bacterium]
MKTYREGQIYAIELSDGSYTIAQLIVNFRLENSTYCQNTFAFFNYKDTLEILKKNIAYFDLKNPFAIATTNSNPRVYGWKLIDERECEISFDYKKDISQTLGLYKDCSTDPSVFLEPYFGLFPYDGYYKDDLVDEDLLPNAEKRDDIKYLKDFTTDELKELLPPNSPKLIQRLKEEENN